MSRRAWAYMVSVYASAALMVWFSARSASAAGSPWLTLAALAFLSILGSLFKVGIPNRITLNAQTIFFFAGLFLLPFWQFAILVVIVQLATWFQTIFWKKEGERAVTLLLFDIARNILAGGSASVILFAMARDLTRGGASIYSLAVISAGIIFAMMNQVLAGLALQLVKGRSFDETRVLRDIFLAEFPLVCLGYSTVLAWKVNPWLVLLALLPLVLVYQAFHQPMLQAEHIQQVQKKNLELALANEVIQRMNGDLFRTMARAFDARDPFVGEHTAQVAVYALAIAGELGLSPERTEMLRQASFLHDIGKIAIPEAVLNKAGPLTRDEYNQVQTHSTIGADLIHKCEGLQHLAPFIRHHHERWDGLGYPNGLRGAEIPLEARILNLCDAVESMATHRAYHEALSASEIMQEVQRCKGSQFDPILVDTFNLILRREGEQFILHPHAPMERSQDLRDLPRQSPSSTREYQAGLETI